MSIGDSLLLFWAKKRDGIDYPLLYHMLDTTAVVQVLWDRSLYAEAKHFMTMQLGVTEDEARLLISFWAGLHDIGKASPGFQCQSEETKRELRILGFSISSNDCAHGTITAYVLAALLSESIGRNLARNVATTVGGHHGIFPRSQDVIDVPNYLGNKYWEQARRILYDKMVELCNIGVLNLPPGNPSPSFYMFLAGLTSVADWIASNEDCFSYKVEHRLEDHLSYAHDRACHALDKLGWAGWQPLSSPAQIEHLFPRIIKEIRPLQQEVINLATTLESYPGLVIIEAPMGEGKTEAAIYLADCWATALGQKGCYFALPTMATSNQMFGRVKDYLQNRYNNERVNLMLLHGHAALSSEFESIQNAFRTRAIFGEDGYDGASAGVVASEWFTYRKRGLLAPFGVGTVDQVLLAVLQTRHVFVRLLGLACKTVIIDEVHAYDAYMTTLLERLLEWLAALGTSVIMLSATLPRKRRDALLRAYARGSGKDNKDIPIEVYGVNYPCISWAVEGEFKAKSIASSKQSEKMLRLQWMNGNLPEDCSKCELGEQLKEALSQGGCAAIICNTVDRAQQVYRALKPYFPEQDAGDGYPELDLLHARYLFGERDRREDRTLKRFGKDNTHRPKRAVLVATQVIEQSLDLDFDLMVTEMAPVDLLLQRAGRLHRHTRERPERLNEPALWICQPDITKGIPDFGSGTEAVYELHILLRSWLAIRDKQVIRIPEEVEQLIEEVYDERECPAELAEEIKRKWKESWEEHMETLESEKEEAKTRWIKWPGYSGELCHLTEQSLEEDNPDIHKAHQAMTRLTGLTISVLCLFGNQQHIYLDPEGTEAIDTRNTPDAMMVKNLLKRSVTISHRGFVEYLIERGSYFPIAWKDNALLRHQHIILFNESCESQLDKYNICLDSELGLIIRKSG